MTILPLPTAPQLLRVELPATAEDVSRVLSKDLRKVARAMGVSPTITVNGQRVYKNQAQLRSELHQFLQHSQPAIAEEPLATPEPQPEALIVPTPDPTPQEDFKVVVTPGTTQKPVKLGTKIALVAEMLVSGATLADLKAVVSQPHGYFHWDLKGKGLGVNKVGDRFFLVLPPGQPELIYR